MSERGSFITEYIYCDKCFTAAKGVLIHREKGLCSTTIPTWELPKRHRPIIRTLGLWNYIRYRHWRGKKRKELPIIAGNVGGSYPGEEIHIFKSDLVGKLSEVICHPLRIAIIPDCGDEVCIVANPKETMANGT